MGNQKLRFVKNKIRSELERLRLKTLYQFYPEPKNVLFDHLPKCGGSSLNNYLVKQYSTERIFSIDGISPDISINDFKKLSQDDRYKFNLVKGHYANQLFEFVNPNSVKITVLREPVERIVSHYYYAKRRTDHYLHSTIINNGLTLEEYATSGLSKELNNWYVCHFSGLTLSEFSEDIIPFTLQKILNDYNLIGFLDDYQSFISKLEKLANYRLPFKDVRLNVTYDRIPLSQIPQRTKNLISEVNHLDVQLYDELKETLRKQLV